MAGPTSSTEPRAFSTAERHQLWTVPEISPSASVPASEMTASNSSEDSSAAYSARAGPRDKVSRRASIAILAADPSQDLPPRLTTDPLLLKPAMQSCLKNSFRLSLPFNPSTGNFSAEGVAVPPSAQPYPSPSIIFPSEADTRAQAFAQQMSAQQQVPFGITSSQHAVHQHYDRSRERTAILELEDGRRASDPDVATDFENELFRWAEQEDLNSQNQRRGPHPASLRSISGASSLNTGTLNSPSAFDDGYGADLDSPMIDRQQHRVGTRIHTQVGHRNKLRARTMAGRDWVGWQSCHSSDSASEQTTQVNDVAAQHKCGSGPPSTVASPIDEDGPIIKTPRFSLHTEMVPRIGSPTHDSELTKSQSQTHPVMPAPTPAIVLPMESPEEDDFAAEVEQVKADDAVQQLRSRARTSTLNAPKTPYNFDLACDKTVASSSLRPPAESTKPAKASLPPVAESPSKAARPVSLPASMPPPGLVKQSGPVFAPSAPIPIPGPTKLQSRRPNSLRLRNLPDASIWAPVEIEVNGKNLAGRNMQAVAVYDPRKDSADAMGEALETAKAETEAKALIENATPQTGQAMLNEGEVNPPPPTPPRGAHLRGAARVRTATLNAIALKVNMMPNAQAQEGTTQNAHITEEPESEDGAPFVGLGVGIGLGLSAGKDGRVHLHGANAPEYDDSTPGEQPAPPKHRSLPNKLPEKVIPRPEVDNWLKDSTKPQPGADQEVAKPKNMEAWARKTFEATGRGSDPGVINAPPSAYVGAAPSPCPGFAAADEIAPSPRIVAHDEDSDVERKKHRAAAEAKLNGTPLLEANPTLEDIFETKDKGLPERSPKPPMKKGFVMAALPSNAVSLNSASTTASARPFFAGSPTAAATKPKRAINVPRTAVLAKDRARRPADASETDRSAQLETVLAAFSTEQLLAHLASRRGMNGVNEAVKMLRKASGGGGNTTGVAPAPPSMTGDMSPRMRSPLVPQKSMASPSLNSSPCLPSRCGGASSAAMPRSMKRNSAQRALARNRQRLAGGGENAAGPGSAPLMARMDSISSVGSADMVREDSVSSFGSFFNQSPMLLSSAAIQVDLSAGQDDLLGVLSGPGPTLPPLIDLTSPTSRDVPGFASLAAPQGRTTSSNMQPSYSQASSSELNSDDRLSLLTSTSSNQVPSVELLTPATGMSAAITPIGTLITSAFARALPQSQPPLDFSRRGEAPRERTLINEYEGADEGGAMLMERSDSMASPALMAS
ncbi:hypothetical protein OC842_000343 [Tilletia horrida]|uniref:Uncharacterized protein n=1 Tax=Tilletia horrida TaxID=155126 RepID=A0AAN6GJK7_9BASI|nr:hypothetical protein OC842_000343 [Tilletia horrida]